MIMPGIRKPRRNSVISATLLGVSVLATGSVAGDDQTKPKPTFFVEAPRKPEEPKPTPPPPAPVSQLATISDITAEWQLPARLFASKIGPTRLSETYINDWSAIYDCKRWQVGQTNEFARYDLEQEVAREAIFKPEAKNRFRYMVQVELGIYDFERDGFPVKIPALSRRIEPTSTEDTKTSSGAATSSERIISISYKKLTSDRCPGPDAKEAGARIPRRLDISLVELPRWLTFMPIPRDQGRALVEHFIEKPRVLWADIVVDLDVSADDMTFTGKPVAMFVWREEKRTTFIRGYGDYAPGSHEQLMQSPLAATPPSTEPGKGKPDDRKPTPQPGPPKDGGEEQSVSTTWYAQSLSRVRDEPNLTSSKVVGQLRVGESIEILSKIEGTDWYKVRYRNGTAFVSGSVIAPFRPAITGVVDSLPDTGRLVVDGIEIRLHGVTGVTEMASQMLGFIKSQGGRVSCQPRDDDNYICLLGTVDLAEAALINGAARASPDASAKYRQGESEARSKSVGIWR